MPDQSAVEAVIKLTEAPALRTLGSLMHTVVRDCLWTTFRQLPLSVAACTAACWIVGAIPASLVLVAASLHTSTILCGLFICFTIAGFVWGFHRAMRSGVQTGAQAITAHASKLLDELLAPVTRMADDHVPRVRIAQIRASYQESWCSLSKPAGQHGWSRPTGWLASVIASRTFSAEWAILDRILTSFENRGESEISAATLRHCLREGSLEQFETAFRSTMWQADLVTAVIVFLLLVLPTTALTWAT